MTPRDVLDFWLHEHGPEDWYKQDDALDADIHARFRAAWEGLQEGGFTDWLADADGALAYIVLADQFPRNMFRGDGRSFATDPEARAAARTAIAAGWDMEIAEPARQFFYLPLMHSEEPQDQALCIEMFAERMPETGAENLLHARAHAEVIDRYGRFPHRNAALGRPDDPSESVYHSNGGYVGVVQQMRDAEPD